MATRRSVRLPEGKAADDRQSAVARGDDVVGGGGAGGGGPVARSHGVSWWVAFAALLISRSVSAGSNIVHDCDETYNYWEPLHFLLHGHGLQTWEYSPQFALRSYLYLLLHAAVAWPASLVLGDGESKYLTFYTVRVALGVVSAATEAALATAVAAAVEEGLDRHCSRTKASKDGSSAHSERSGSSSTAPSPLSSSSSSSRSGSSSSMGRRVGMYTLVLLCFCSGPFLASTTMLPSTFSMYGITWATALVLRHRACAAVAVAAAAVILGWPFAVLAAAPIVAFSFARGSPLHVFAAGAASSIVTLAASVAVDSVFFGRWPTCSVLNLVVYNALGGGDSALYGVEGPLFYLRNLALNLNLALPLALLLPLLWLLLPQREVRRTFGPVVAACAPLFLWLGFMSLQPHKEERFLFLVYPLVCMAAASAVALLPEVLPMRLRWTSVGASPTFLLQAAKWLRPICIATILLLSYCRTKAVLLYYSAPMDVYHRHIPPSLPATHDNANHQVTVCVGSEWHRFPSSFFLPSPRHRIAFVDDGFRGLLPFPFNTSAASASETASASVSASAAGETAAAGAVAWRQRLAGTSWHAPHFNKLNKAEHGQFVEDETVCDFLIEFDDRPHPPHRRHDQKPTDGGSREDVRTLRGDDAASWQVLHEQPFLVASRTPALSRALLLPLGLSQRHAVFGSYRVLQRKH